MFRFHALAFAAILASLAPAAAQDSPITRASAEVSISAGTRLAQDIRRVLAGRVAVELYNRPVKGYPAGSRLHVRVSDVSVGQDEAMHTGPSLFDSMQGEVIVLDARGAEIERKSLTAWPKWSAQGENTSRLQALVAAFAYTAVHKVGR